MKTKNSSPLAQKWEEEEKGRPNCGPFSRLRLDSSVHRELAAAWLGLGWVEHLPSCRARRPRSPSLFHPPLRSHNPQDCLS